MCVGSRLGYFLVLVEAVVRAALEVVDPIWEG